MLAIVFMLLCASTWASAQMFKEDFNYTAGDSLRNHGWIISGTSVVNPLIVTSQGLTFNNYPGSGVGNALHLTVTGQDLYRSFPADSIGSLYAGFLINVDSLAATGDYFLGLSPAETQTNYYARTFIKSSGTGFLMGLSKSNETATYGTTVFSFGTTYLVVLKHTFVAKDSNDAVSLFVLSPGASVTTEPAVSEVVSLLSSTKADTKNLGIITLRQGSGAGTTPALTIDGIRIDSTWAGVTVAPVVPPFPENFDYAAGDSLTAHNWLVSSGGTTNAILTTTPGLTFTNYPLSGIGNAATMTNNGQDVFKSFAKDSGGSFYSTFMLKVTAAQATGDYFYALSPAESQTGYTGRLFIRSSGAGFQFGISKSNEAAIYGSTVFNLNTTYLTVVKYSFDFAKDSNDVIKVYVLASGAALTAEPAVAEIADTATSRADAKNFGFVTLRQGGATAAPSLVIDGIRVEKSWYKAMGVPTLENFYSVGTGSVAGEKAHFASMKSALDSLSNGMPIPSNTTFYITSDITEPEIGGKGLGLAVDPTPYTVTFKPAAGVKPTITLQYPSDGNSGPSGAFVIGMNSAAMAWADLKPTRNIVFDGSNSEGGKSRDLTIQTTGIQRNAIPLAIVGDVQNVTIKNCNVLYKVVPTAASTSGSLLVYSILIRTATTANTGTVEKTPSNLTIDNNWLSSNFTGVTASIGGIGGYAAAAISTYPTKITISNNKIEAIRHGVGLYYLGSTNVTNNEIIVNQNVASVSSEAIMGVNTLPTATYNITNNKITKLAVRDSSALTGSGGIGAISIEGKGTYNVYNNMISGFSLAGTSTDKNAYLYGIRVADSAVANIYYNTIRMDSVAPIGAGTVNYRGLYFSNGINTVKNNIVANYEDDFASVNVYRGNTGTVGTLAGTLTADYNDYYRAGTSNALTGFKDTTKATNMTLWRVASGVDANSMIGAPGFISATDLHIDTRALLTPVISDAGVPVAGVTTDIDGEARNATTPDIGADEFTMVPPVSSIPVVTIGEARIDANNDFIADHSIKLLDTLKIYGVVMSPNYGASYPQLSYFIQDATGGIDLFGYTLPATPLDIGDSVYAVGTVAQYKGLVEFTPGAMDAAHFGVVKKNAVVPAPKRLTLHEFAVNAEKYEGQLIEIDTLYKSSGTWPAAAANVSIYLSNVSSKGDSAQMFLDLDMNIFGTEPVYPINVVGIVSQYSAAAPWSNGYEIMPRGISDIKSIKVTGVNGIASGLPVTYELMNNFPNPFNPSTVIRFALPQQSMARLIVYDMLGREVRTLVNGMTNAGYFESTWNGKNNDGVQVASGMYIYRIEAGSFVSSKKMMLLK